MITINIYGEVEEYEIENAILELHLFKNQIRLEKQQKKKELLKEHIREQDINDSINTFKNAFDSKKS
jgi:hypothetical protein